MKNYPILFLFIFVFACSSGNDTRTQVQEIVPEQEKSDEIQNPFEFFEAKTVEAGRFTHVMELYYLTGEFSNDDLKTFLKVKKNDYSEDGIYYFVLFDSKENAVFPIQPITAEYEIEEEPQKHIKAFYMYNKINGYSKLNTYEKNRWESQANTDEI